MNKIILLFLILHNKINPFIENVITQEYSIMCNGKKSNCINIDILYQECGLLLFNIWLSLDLLLSVNIDFNDYDSFYFVLQNKIDLLYDKILTIVEKNDTEHNLDNKKLIVYMNKIIKHQIVKYNDSLLFNINKCKQKITENYSISYIQ